MGIFLTFTLITVPARSIGQTTTAQQTADPDCEKIKKDIEELQTLITQISIEMQRLTELLDQLNERITKTQADLKVATANANSGIWSEALRTVFLNNLGTELALRRKLKQEIDNDANLIQTIKDEIADLLNKLASCTPPSATQPSKQETPTEQPPTPPPPKPVPSSAQTSMGTTGAGIQFQLRGFGGAGFVNGNTPATGGFDGAVLFPLGNRILIGPTAGFQYINSSIVNSIGSHQTGSTFIDTSAGFKQGNFGGLLNFHVGQLIGNAGNPEVFFHGLNVGVLGGASVAGSTITQAEGFCGGTGGSLPPGCTVTSTTTTHDTVTGPFVGGYISHSIFSHVGVFVGYDYHFGLKDTKPNPTSPTGPRVSILDLHYSDVVAGINFTFGRHHEK